MSHHLVTSARLSATVLAGAVLAVSAAGTADAAHPSPAAPAATSSSGPRLIAYAGGESPGVEVHNRAQARKLHGAPPAFKRFIGRTAQRLADHTTCDGGDVGVTVDVLRTDGYAAGGVNDCGGYSALWATVDGRWKQIQGTQEVWSCRVLRRHDVPSDVAGDRCYDYAAGHARHYHHA